MKSASKKTVTCHYCHIICVGTGTRDHVIPKVSGGSKFEHVWSCKRCNFAKGHLSVAQFKNTDYWRQNVASRRWHGMMLVKQTNATGE